MENDNNIEKALSPSARAAHHRGQNAAVATERRWADKVCWCVTSHERGHDRFVLRPSANHPCCTYTCASSSGSS